MSRSFAHTSLHEMHVALSHLIYLSLTSHDQLWAAKWREGRGGRAANRTQGGEGWGRGGQSLSLLQGPDSQKACCKAKQPCISSQIPTIFLLLHAQEIAGVDKQQALIALGRFKSCVRTSLLLCDGYECQEKEGTFLVAFASPRAAVEWALTLQLALMRYSQKLPCYAVICHALLSYVTLLFKL